MYLLGETTSLLTLELDQTASQPTIICLKLTIKTQEQRCEIFSNAWRRFGVLIIKLEHISHLCSNVSNVNFEHVIANWDIMGIF